MIMDNKSRLPLYKILFCVTTTDDVILCKQIWIVTIPGIKNTKNNCSVTNLRHCLRQSFTFTGKLNPIRSLQTNNLFEITFSYAYASILQRKILSTYFSLLQTLRKLFKLRLYPVTPLSNKKHARGVLCPYTWDSLMVSEWWFKNCVAMRPSSRWEHINASSNHKLAMVKGNQVYYVSCDKFRELHVKTTLFTNEPIFSNGSVNHIGVWNF